MKTTRQITVKPNVVHVRSCVDCPFVGQTEVEIDGQGQVVDECRGGGAAILLDEPGRDDSVPDFCPMVFNVYVWPGVEMSSS